jgi:hypothetical protein
MITLEDRYKTTFIIKWDIFVWLIMPFMLKNMPPTYQQTINKAFKEYLVVFIKCFKDDFNVFNDLKTHMAKLRLCFDTCQKFGINLNLEKCMFLVFFDVIFDYIMCKEWKLQVLKNIAAIFNMPKPKPPKDIQIFNGMAQFYRCFI